MIDTFVKETFLKLTSKTYPYGYESDLLQYLPKGLQNDGYGNYFLSIGHAKSIFACHLDTACKDQVNVIHQFQTYENINYIGTDGKSILGADDKAGVTVLLWMIENQIPGLYYFFTGEEVGCIGSRAASKDPAFEGYNRIISFDRRGTSSVITHQSYTRTCSDFFATSLISELNKYGMKYKIDDTGIYTDSAEFTSVIAECTNISVGYYKEHTFQEHQDIDHLISLCKAVIKVDWESLPSHRDITKTEYKDYSYGIIGEDYTSSNSPYNGNSISDNSWKKTRRSKKKYQSNVGRIYHDDLDNELVIIGNAKYASKAYSRYDDYDDFYSNKNEFYSLVKHKFFDELTKEEMEIVQEQYGYSLAI